MMFSNPTTVEIRTILQNAKTIAVIGISEREDRASKYVSEYLQRQGYTIYPVNPNIDEWNGLKAYDSVTDLPVSVDIVDVFRRSSEVLPLAGDAVEVFNCENTCQFAFDGFCNETIGGSCEFGTDCFDCGSFQWDATWTTTYRFRDNGTIDRTETDFLTETNTGGYARYVECTAVLAQ